MKVEVYNMKKNILLIVIMVGVLLAASAFADGTPALPGQQGGQPGSQSTFGPGHGNGQPNNPIPSGPATGTANPGPAMLNPLQNIMTLNSGKFNITVEDITLRGTVASIEIRAGEGVVLIVRANDKLYTVHTGPIWMMGANLKNGQQIEVVGKLITVNDDQFVIAYKITTNGNEYVLKNDNGSPANMGPMGPNPNNHAKNDKGPLMNNGAKN